MDRARRSLLGGDGEVKVSGALRSLAVLGAYLSLPVPARAQVPAQERSALIALYEATNGADWTKRDYWRNAANTDFNDPGTECTWLGVGCLEGHVVTLSLAQNHLTGSIPAEIGNLAQLYDLFLYGNELAGNIPASLGGLPNLRYVWLYANALTGAIPPSLGRCPNMTDLGLSYNQLSGDIPESLGDLTNLQSLNLSFNRLTGNIPLTLGQLTNVQSLNLGVNQLTGSIPSTLGHLTALRRLQLCCNQLSGNIPTALADLPNVEGLGLYQNRLTGSIPPALGRLTKLEWLDVDSNQLSGSVPAELGNLTKLDALGLASNQLGGELPTALANLTNLGRLGLRWDGLHTSDAALRAWADHLYPGWDQTQTVPVTDLAGGSPTATSVALSWTPISYVADTGGYRILASTTTGGPYTHLDTTTSKASSSATVAGLSPDTTYHFVLESVTNPHANNQNAVVSERSAEVSARTAAGAGARQRLTVVLVGQGRGSVASLPAGIQCGGLCSATFGDGSPVSLQATTTGGSIFVEWQGDCAGASAICDLTMDGARTVTAVFAPGFHTMTPCRAFDSRDPNAGGTGPLAAGSQTAIAVGGRCGIPAEAQAVSLNVTVTAPSGAGFLTLFPEGRPAPLASTVNYAEGQTRANSAITTLGPSASLAIFVGQAAGTVHVLLDVNGYFE